MTSKLTEMPQEIILCIFSYLDMPDLQAISQISSVFMELASDPILHRTRLRVVAPSRVQHSLFALGPQGGALRPTIRDLVERNIMRGLDIPRRFRMGNYLYTSLSIRQYEASLRVVRGYASHVVSGQLKRRKNAPDGALLKSLHQAHVLPDEESSSFFISRTLLPVMRKLKWSFQRDKLAKMVRDGTMCGVAPSGDSSGVNTFATWLEARGRGIVHDGERVRLALCPDVMSKIKRYEMHVPDA